MDPQPGFILIIIGYILNAVMFTLVYLEDKNLIVFMRAKPITVQKPVSLKHRALHTTGL